MTENVVETGTLLHDITAVLNKHSRENTSNTPDFILAEVMIGALMDFERASNLRENWYDKHLSINDDQGRWFLNDPAFSHFSDDEPDV